MFRRSPSAFSLLLLVSANLTLVFGLEPTSTVAAPPLRMALTNNIFREVPESEAKQAKDALKTLVENQTKRPAEISIEEKVSKLATDLADGKLDYGVFLGHEFAWARQANPKLRPLLIAVAGDIRPTAHVIVRQDCQATGLAQLQGKICAIPKGSKGFTRLYLTRQCKSLQKTPQTLFSQVTVPANLEDALDDVVDGVVQVTVVDNTALEAFKRRKPGRAVKLKEIQKSEVFPSPVIAYHEGTMDEGNLAKTREDLLGANDDAEGKRFLTLWKLTRFDKVPEDFEKTLEACAKSYPAE